MPPVQTVAAWTEPEAERKPGCNANLGLEFVALHLSGNHGVTRGSLMRRQPIEHLRPGLARFSGSAGQADTDSTAWSFRAGQKLFLIACII